MLGLELAYPLGAGDGLHLGLLPREHPLEHPQVPHVHMGHFRQQWVVIGGVLVVGVVANEDHLDFAHVVFLVHLEGAPVDDLLDGGLVRPGVIPVLVDVVVNLVRKFVAFFEALMVCADENHAQIDLSEADVHMKHILFGAPRDTNWSPRLSVCHRAECHHEVEDHSYVYKRSKMSN